MSIKISVDCRVTEYLIQTEDYKHTSKISNIKFLTAYCFVFLQKMQPGGLFEVNEATNVFFMIFRDCFISENDKFSLVEKIVRSIKTLIRQISLVKNIVCSKIRILFHHSTARKSLYSYNK